MRKIRKLYYFDKKNMREMISFLNSSDTYVNHIMFNPLLPLHHLLPLRYKFMPESYVLKDNNAIKGLITIAPIKAPLMKMEIQRLFFKENCYYDAAELVQYVVSKYKAQSASSFIVRIDDCMPELIKLFVLKCDFCQISYERLWRVNDIIDVGSGFDKKCIRKFRNSDAAAVANAHNASLLPHFRLLLSANSWDYKDSCFKGLLYFTEYKFVFEDPNSKNIMACVSIKTSDNENYILDMFGFPWHDIDIYSVINFAKHQISKRQKKFNLFVKTKKYTHSGEKLDKEFMQRKFECVQTQIVLTNSSAEIANDESYSGKFVVLSQFRNLRPLCKDL